MSDEAVKKATAATAETMDEVFQEATSVPEAQRRVQDLVESSLAALRVNVHSALNTNAKIITSWKELLDRVGPAAK
jgi:hypothetical protein